MTTLDEDPMEDPLTQEATEADTSAESLEDEADESPDSEAHSPLVEVPDTEMVADAVELDIAPEGDPAPPEDGAEVVGPPAARRLSRRAHRAEMKASARRVRRVVRHIDTWSVFKVASIFVACIWGIVVLASLLIWRAAVTSGSVENTEDFIVDLGFEDFNFNPEQMFEALLSAGAVFAIATVFFIWLLTVLFNLICDLTGGLRITMIEQDLADARKRRRAEKG